MGVQSKNDRTHDRDSSWLSAFFDIPSNGFRQACGVVCEVPLHTDPDAGLIRGLYAGLVQQVYDGIMYARLMKREVPITPKLQQIFPEYPVALLLCESTVGRRYFHCCQEALLLLTMTCMVVHRLRRAPHCLSLAAACLKFLTRFWKLGGIEAALLSSHNAEIALCNRIRTVLWFIARLLHPCTPLAQHFSEAQSHFLQMCQSKKIPVLTPNNHNGMSHLLLTNLLSAQQPRIASNLLLHMGDLEHLPFTKLSDICHKRLLATGWLGTWLANAMPLLPSLPNIAPLLSGHGFTWVNFSAALVHPCFGESDPLLSWVVPTSACALHHICSDHEGLASCQHVHPASISSLIQRTQTLAAHGGLLFLLKALQVPTVSLKFHLTAPILQGAVEGVAAVLADLPTTRGVPPFLFALDAVGFFEFWYSVGLAIAPYVNNLSEQQLESMRQSQCVPNCTESTYYMLRWTYAISEATECCCKQLGNGTSRAHRVVEVLSPATYTAMVGLCAQLPLFRRACNP